MKHVLTKPTLINGLLRPIGTVIDTIAEPGEIESMVRVGRAARKVPANEADTDEDPDAPDEHPENDPELDVPDPDDMQTLPVDEEDILENEASQAAEVDADDLAEAIEQAGLPSNVYDSLVAAKIVSLGKLTAKLKEPGFKFSSIQGIGPKTETRIRESFPV